MNTDKIREYLVGERDEFMEDSQRTLQGYNGVLDSLVKGTQRFDVKVRSFFGNAGEPGITFHGEGEDIGEILARADAGLNEQNHRRDDQREYEVNLVVGDFRVLIPQELYQSYIDGIKAERE